MAKRDETGPPVSPPRDEDLEQLSTHLLGDLMGVLASLHKIRTVLTDAMVNENQREVRRCVGQARHNLGSALQILQAALDEAHAIRDVAIRKGAEQTPK